MYHLLHFCLFMTVMLVSYRNGGWAEVGQSLLIGFWIAVSMSKVFRSKTNC